MFAIRFVFVVHLLARSVAGQEITDAQLSLEDRVFTASKVYALLKIHFVHSNDVPDATFDVQYRSYLQKILASDDRRQFDLATIEFVAQLHNGHTLFWDSWFGKRYGQPLGFYARPIGGKWVVQWSSLDTLKPGEVLLALDGVLMEDFFRQQQRYISASSTSAQRHRLFSLPYLFPEQFVVTIEGGQKVTIRLGSVKEPEEKTEARWIKPNQTAYVHIPSFFYPRLEEKALEYVRQFRNAKTLLIDLRGNRGGVPPVRLIQGLMDRPYRNWKESSPVHVGLFDSSREATKNTEAARLPDYSRGQLDALAFLGRPQLSWGGELVAPGQPIFRGRVLLLVDGGCVSACEDFAEPFKDNGRATLVGETTQGSTGLPFFYDFQNGMTLRIAVKQEFFPDGSEFEGIGIKPDVEVSLSVDDIKNGRDSVLEKALALVNKNQ